jgi:phage-related baseplate assembly protein
MPYIVLLTVVTSVELQTQLLNAMAAAGLPTSAWQKKGIWQNLTVWFASMLQLVYAVLNDVARGAFLDTATDQALIDLGEFTYKTKYRSETFATGTITLLNDSGSQIDEPADGLSIAQVADSSITYKNSGAITGWLNGTQLVVPLVCDQAGTVGNVPADASAPFQLSMVTTIVGVSIVEHTAMVGQDNQDQEEYRRLCRQRAASLSPRGGDGAYEWTAKNLYTDGTRIDPENPDPTKTAMNINRVRVEGDNTDGTVDVSLASPSGAVDPTEFATTVAALNQYVTPSATILLASNCTTVTVAVTATVTLRKGSSSEGVQAIAEQALTDYFPTSSIGGDDGFITVDELKGVLFRVSTSVHGVSISLPAADVALSTTQVAIAGVMTVTVTVQP